jgi:hypothetical protein
MYKRVNDFLIFSNTNTDIYEDYVKNKGEEYNNFSKKNKDPKVWGPIYWFNLHNSSNYYPNNPSKKLMEITKNRIISIPYELPCEKCKIHSVKYINTRSGELDIIVSSKTNLFNFYVDFHNYVNFRNNKKIYSYEEARKIWS